MTIPGLRKAGAVIRPELEILFGFVLPSNPPAIAGWCQEPKIEAAHITTNQVTKTVTNICGVPLGKQRYLGIALTKW